MSSRPAASSPGPGSGAPGLFAPSLVEPGNGVNGRAVACPVESESGEVGPVAALLVGSEGGGIGVVTAECAPVIGGAAVAPAANGRGVPRSRSARDRGSISLLMVAMGTVFVVALVVAIGLGGARVARHRAQNAADAGALAGAVWAIDGPLSACAVAGRVVSANDARLVSCSADGLDVRVTVEVRLTGSVPAGRASARAGPVRDTSAPTEPGG